MKKTLLVTFSALLLFGFLVIAVVGNEPEETPQAPENKEEAAPAEAEKADKKIEPADVITLGRTSDTFEPTTLHHKKHSEEYKVGDKSITCKDCHHKSEKEDHSDIKTCFECHKIESEDEAVPNLVDAYHKQCIECHEQANEKNKNENALVGCMDCHASK